MPSAIQPVRALLVIVTVACGAATAEDPLTQDYSFVDGDHASALIDSSTTLVSAGSGARKASLFHPAVASEVIATPVAQDRSFGGPTPADNYSGGGNRLLPPLNIPDAKVKCCQDGPRGRQCQVDRYLEKPIGIDPDCLICVKEPYRTTEPVKEQVEVVIHRCFEAEVPFSKEDCEDGTWYRKEGKKLIRRLRPCTTLVNLEYEKQVVRYRDVWYHVRCQ